MNLKRKKEEKHVEMRMQTKTIMGSSDENETSSHSQRTISSILRISLQISEAPQFKLWLPLNTFDS